jgi:hypothetical protein
LSTNVEDSVWTIKKWNVVLCFEGLNKTPKAKIGDLSSLMKFKNFQIWIRGYKQ